MLAALGDRQLMWLFGGVLCLLVLSSLIGGILKRRHRPDASRATIDNLNARIRAWWKMCAIFALSLLVGRVGSLILFALISFLAMREYMTPRPSARHCGGRRRSRRCSRLACPSQFASWDLPED